MSIGEYQIPIITKGGQNNWNQLTETDNLSFEDLAFEKQSGQEVSEETAERAHNFRLKLESSAEAKRALVKEIQSKQRKAFGAKMASVFKRLAA